MRQPCKCGSVDGTITTKGGQDIVHCAACRKWQYNAPKTETGRSPRPTGRDDLPASQKARIRERDGNRCIICGATAAEATLHVSHIASVKDIERLKNTVDALLIENITNKDEASKAAKCIGLLLRHYVNTDGNLFVSCDACNLGQGERTIAPKLAVMITSSAYAT